MFVRRFMVFWAMSLITWVILTVFTDVDKLDGNVVTAMSLVVGLLSTVIGFYNYQRRLDQQEQNDVDDNSRGP
jgi:predicted histidine transporter YuiF (NhaC family)